MVARWVGGQYNARSTTFPLCHCVSLLLSLLLLLPLEELLLLDGDLILLFSFPGVLHLGLSLSGDDLGSGGW